MTVNLVDVFHIERRGPIYGDRSVILDFYGKTPGDKDLKMSILLPDYGIDTLAGILHGAIKDYERLLAITKESLQGRL